MKPIKTYVHYRRHMRTLNKMIKRNKNEAKAYRDEAMYHQAIIDNIIKRFNLCEDFKKWEEQ